MHPRIESYALHFTFPPRVCRAMVNQPYLVCRLSHPSPGRVFQNRFTLDGYKLAGLGEAGRVGFGGAGGRDRQL